MNNLPPGVSQEELEHNPDYDIVCDNCGAELDDEYQEVCHTCGEIATPVSKKYYEQQQKETQQDFDANDAIDDEADNEELYEVRGFIQNILSEQDWQTVTNDAGEPMGNEYVTSDEEEEYYNDGSEDSGPDPGEMIYNTIDQMIGKWLNENGIEQLSEEQQGAVDEIIDKMVHSTRNASDVDSGFNQYLESLGAIFGVEVSPESFDYHGSEPKEDLGWDGGREPS